ncbi:insulin-like growth factor 2 [Megalopta genalis]|uniref:insulin-like growth factor 2 n=1 Tax=Megalopta genalis TaxID=115081 RepID=UPI0014434BA2|nr:insulin-like growth factor I [Megalopta genalis]
MTRSYATARRGRAKRMVLMGLVLLTLLDTVIAIPTKRSLLRLCSTSLSDALYLVCKGRGYNEPFSNSSEVETQDPVGPGLAEQCCYRTCSYTELEQYCKPNISSPADAVKESTWIENSVYPSVRPGTSSEERSRTDIDYVAGTIKYKTRGLKGARRKGTNLDRDDAVGCDGRSSVRRHRGCRPRRQKHRRHGKPSEAALADRSSRAQGYH